jgi:hypothetical protein
VGVGARAVLGVVLVAALVGLGAGLLLRGGDDGGPDDASSPGSPSSPAEDEADGADGTGEFEVDVPDDGSAAELPVRLEAGDALRVVVEGLDSALLLAADDEARTDGFDSLEPRSQTLGVELGDGLIFLATDRSGDDVEGLQFVAPSAGTYTVLVTGSGGEADVTIEVEEGDDADLGEDEIDYLDYLAHYGEHVDFFCDADFFGGDPEDTTNYGPTVCDEESLEGVLAGELNGDFTNDFDAGSG